MLHWYCMAHRVPRGVPPTCVVAAGIAPLSQDDILRKKMVQIHHLLALALHLCPHRTDESITQVPPRCALRCRALDSPPALGVPASNIVP